MRFTIEKHGRTLPTCHPPLSRLPQGRDRSHVGAAAPAPSHRARSIVSDVAGRACTLSGGRERKRIDDADGGAAAVRSAAIVCTGRSNAPDSSAPSAPCTPAQTCQIMCMTQPLPSLLTQPQLPANLHKCCGAVRAASLRPPVAGWHRLATAPGATPRR